MEIKITTQATSITDLPAEIVLMIIEYNTLLHTRTPRTETLSRGILNHPIFQFCRLFRNVALASPLVWTRIRTAYPFEAQQLIARSGDCPLDVALDCNSSVWTVVTPLIHRCRTLGLEHPYDFLLPQLIQVISLPAPLLQSFSICTKSNITTSAPYLFKGMAPHLRTLHLPWLPLRGDPVWKNLTTLELCAAQNIDALHLCSIISSANALTNLKFKKCSLVSHSNARDTLLNLESLHNLKVTTPVLKLWDQCVGNFLVRFLHTCSISTLVDVEANMSWPCEFFVPSQSLHQGFYSECDDLVLVTSQDHRVTLKRNTRPGRATLKIPRGMQAPHESQAEDDISVLNPGWFPELWKVTFSNIPPSMMKPILHKFPSISKLVITFKDGEDNGGLIRELSSTKPTPLLPRLSHLEFRQGFGRNPVDEHHDALVECLRRRASSPWIRLKRLVVPKPWVRGDKALYQSVFSPVVENLIYASKERSDKGSRYWVFEDVTMEDSLQL